MTAESLYSSVRQVVLEHWPSVQEMTPPESIDQCPFLFGRFGDVDMELKTASTGGTPIVRATVQLARFVPLSRPLIERMNALNQHPVGPTLGLSSDDRLDTVRVSVAASTFGGFIDEVAIRAVVETTVWPANVLLQQGFLTTYGGDLAALVQLRAMIDAAGLLSESQREPALSALTTLADELEARVQAGDIGRLPQG